MKTGKNFTAAQRKTLMKNGISQEIIDEYLLQKQSHVREDTKHLAKNESKQEQWTLIHRTTDHIITVQIN